jgi:hypothetical protein
MQYSAKENMEVTVQPSMFSLAHFFAVDYRITALSV